MRSESLWPGALWNSDDVSEIGVTRDEGLSILAVHLTVLQDRTSNRLPEEC